MGEKTGFLFCLVLSLVFIVPFMLDITYSSIKGNQFLHVSDEIHKLVGEEGGVSERVRNKVKELENSNLYVKFENANTGETISSVVPVGTKINIKYEYEFTSVFGTTENMSTTKSVTINKRN